MSFKVEFMPGHDPPLQHPTEFRFQWSGTWKLTRVMLPTDALNALSATAQKQDASLPASASKRDTNQSTPEPAPSAPEARQQPPASKPQTEASWSIEESKSPIDDSAQVMGMLLAEGSDPVTTTALMLRCREKKTEAIFGKRFSFLGSTRPLKVLVRINDGEPIASQWHPSSDGQFALSPYPEAAARFIRALPDDGKLFMRATGYNGAPVDGSFSLGKVSELRNKIASACRWPDAVAHPEAPKH